MAIEILTKGDCYKAKAFSVKTIFGEFKISGTLCGAVEIAVPDGCTYPMSPDEIQMLIIALTNSRNDVLENSRPNSDPRIID